MNAPEHINDRTQYIGGADAAAILGVSKWKTPVRLWQEKIGEIDNSAPDPAKQKIFRRGKLMEPVILEMLADEYPIKITKRSTDATPNRYIDRDHPFIRAEIDFEFEVTRELIDALPAGFIDPQLVGTIQNGEAKSVDPLTLLRQDEEQAPWGEEYSEDLPIEYAAQTQHGLMVTNRQFCLVAAVFGYNLVLYKVVRDDVIIDGLRTRERSFWHNNVLPRVPPEPINMSDINTLYRKFNGKPVDLDDETYTACTDLRALRESIKVREEEKAALEFQIAKFVCDQWGLPAPSLQVISGGQTITIESDDNADLRYGDTTVATWKRQRGAHLDQKQLRADRPEITAQYTREHWFRPFRFKKPKLPK